MERISFGLHQGQPVERCTLDNGVLRADILTYGGILQALWVPDARGNRIDVVLGCDTLEQYQAQDYYLGAMVGRCANRIAGGRFSLDGVDYPLAVNNGENHLHGGPTGFHQQVWTVAEHTGERLVLTLDSPHGHEGYPGRLQVQVTYRLEGASLSIHTQATTDRPTLCNLTNHSYFNLGGHHSGPILDHTLRLFASRYTPTDSGSIPTGELAPVAGTPMDFTRPTPIGDRIDQDFIQLVQGRGYDHNWCVDGPVGTLRLTAVAHCPATGLSMAVDTTQPGVQLYTANYVDPGFVGKGGALYGPRHAFCLETQNYPDAIHHPNFPSPVLTPEQTYRHQTVFTFSAR